MATPITWQNVKAPDFEAGNALIKSGMDVFNKGVSGVSDVVGKLATEQEDDATALAINQINQLGVADVDAAKQSGDFGANYQGYGDINKIMTALQGREVGARNEANADFEYNQNLITQENTERDTAELGDINKITSLINTGTTENLALAQDMLDQGDYRDESSLYANILTGTDAARTRSNTIEAKVRADEVYDQGEIVRKNVLNLEETVNTIQQNYNDNIGTITAAQTTFAEASDGRVSFKNGRMSFGKDVPLNEVTELISAYKLAREDAPQLRTIHQRRQLVEEAGKGSKPPATNAQIQTAIGQLEAYETQRLDIDPETQALLDASTAAVAEEAKDKLGAITETHNRIVKQWALDPEITRQMEEGRGASSTDIGELIEEDIANFIQEGDFFNSYFGTLGITDDVKPGEEIPQLKAAINSKIAEGYSADGRTEAEVYPGWVIRAAYKSTGGLRGLYSPGYTDDTVDSEPFKIAVDRIMKQHLRAEDNEAKLLAENLKFNAQKSAITSDLKNKSLVGTNTIRSNAGQFREQSAGSILQRETNRLTTNPSLLNSQGQPLFP